VCLFGCKPEIELPTVPDLDLEKYAGRWCKIAHLPNSFEKGLSCVTATYTLREDGKIAVLNQGYDAEKEAKTSAEGTAWIPDLQIPGRLNVRFFWPFTSDCFILDIDKNIHTSSLVIIPQNTSGSFQKKKVSNPVYSQLVERPKQHGFKVEDIVLVEQNCTLYKD
jgi:apolipoprotein D and lipocalin family protein